MNRYLCASGLAVLAAASFGGCGGDSSSKGTNTVTAVAAAGGDLEKIKEALVKAGIKNEPAAVFDMDDSHWSVTITPDGVGPKGEPPPGRPIPMRVSVSKKDFKVEKIADPNSGRSGGGKTGGNPGDGRIVK